MELTYTPAAIPFGALHRRSGFSSGCCDGCGYQRLRGLQLPWRHRHDAISLRFSHLIPRLLNLLQNVAAKCDSAFIIYMKMNFSVRRL